MMTSENVKTEFAGWLNTNAASSYRQYLGNSVQSITERLDEMNSFFNDRDLFEIKDGNFQELVNFLKRNLYGQGRKKHPEFDKYDRRNSRGIPKAILGKNNYFNFLRLKFQGEKFTEGRNNWIFQVSPDIYNIEKALRAGHLKSWKVAAHKGKIQPGDQVILWQTGEKAGCYALAEVNSEVGHLPEEEYEKLYYIDPYNAEREGYRVKIKIVNYFADDPVLWEDIKELPEFENFKAGNQGTNFSATKEEFETIDEIGRAKSKSSYGEVKKMFPAERVENFLRILRSYLTKNNIDPEDERISFNVRLNRKRLVFIIGNRYALMIQKKREKAEYSFISSEIISDDNGNFTNFKGEVEMYKNKVDDLTGLDSIIEKGFTIELERQNKSPYRKFSDQDFVMDVFNTKGGIESRKPKSEMALNKILYGPPGTGKTYRSKELAVRIANPQFSVSNSSDEEKRAEINKEFKRLFDLGQIVFTTFHQSFSYEDFIEGIKPIPPKADREVGYEVQNGVFKILCERAMEEKESFNFEEAYANYIEEVAEKGSIELETPVQKRPFKVHINSNGTSVATPRTEKATEMGVTKEMLWDFIVNGKIRDWKPYTTAIGHYVKEHYGVQVEEVNNKNRNFVIIIDEINRGNVSSILGELITLLEPDKRLGREEFLEVELPYSKEPFSVPSNVYVIGTMNTADRSVEALDTALRRRFVFEELMPQPELLGHISFEGFNLRELLQCINERIEALLDRDHCIGHSYFIKLKDGDIEALKQAFQNKIIPLLQEYFYHDYEKIALILGPGFIQLNKTRFEFAKFEPRVDPPDIRPSYELKAIDDIEQAVKQLLNQ